MSTLILMEVSICGHRRAPNYFTNHFKALKMIEKLKGRNRYTTVPPQQPLYNGPTATTATAIRGCPKKPPFVKPARAESAAMSSGDERTPARGEGPLVSTSWLGAPDERGGPPLPLSG